MHVCILQYIFITTSSSMFQNHCTLTWLRNERANPLQRDVWLLVHQGYIIKILKNVTINSIFMCYYLETFYTCWFLVLKVIHSIHTVEVIIRRKLMEQMSTRNPTRMTTLVLSFFNKPNYKNVLNEYIKKCAVSCC